MTAAFVDKNYVYAVARIRGAEATLLTGSVLEQLITAETAEEVLRILADHGYGSGTSGETAEELLAAERAKTWGLMAELLSDLSVFDVFRLADDYHNLKAAIKESTMQFDYPGIYTEEGTIAAERIRDAIRGRDYAALPRDMQETAERAHDVFLRTGDGQLCDILVDCAALVAIYAAGKRSRDEFLQLYAELTVAAADIKTAVRAALTGKDRAFLEAALCPCDTLDIGRLTEAALNGTEAIAAYLAGTDYADAVEALKASPAAFERWCDNLLIRRIRPQLSNPFGLGPLAAYVLARETEEKSLRIILAAKQNGFSEEAIRERVRETYV